MRFRKRPVEVEAVQYTGDNRDNPAANALCYCTARMVDPHLHTLEGIMIVKPGDWIVTGVKGEKYPVKPDIFDVTYEAASSMAEEKPLMCVRCGVSEATVVQRCEPCYKVDFHGAPLPGEATQCTAGPRKSSTS